MEVYGNGNNIIVLRKDKIMNNCSLFYFRPIYFTTQIYKIKIFTHFKLINSPIGPQYFCQCWV